MDRGRVKEEGRRGEEGECYHLKIQCGKVKGQPVLKPKVEVKMSWDSCAAGLMHEVYHYV